MKYRKKPVVIEAIQFIDNADRISELAEFIDNQKIRIRYDEVNPYMIINTLEGDHKAMEHDYIIKGVAGEFYPCKPEIFAKTYEPVQSDEDNSRFAQIRRETNNK